MGAVITYNTTEVPQNFLNSITYDNAVEVGNCLHTQKDGIEINEILKEESCLKNRKWDSRESNREVVRTIWESCWESRTLAMLREVKG